jgi:Putative amidoligase enzyme
MGARKEERADLYGMRFGVELETLAPIRLDRYSEPSNCPRADVCDAIMSVVGGEKFYRGDGYDTWGVIDSVGREWQVKRDSSLRAEYRDQEAEIVTPILLYPHGLTLLGDIAAAVRAIGGTVNPYCGMHVHIDADGMGGKALTNLMNLVYGREAFLYRALAVSDHRAYRYCQFIDADTIERVNAHHTESLVDFCGYWYGSSDAVRRTRHHYDDTRYRALNLHSYFYRGSIEFRYFGGTLDADVIRAAVQLSAALVRRARAMNYWSKPKRSPLVSQCEKFDFRCFLLRLGMIGDEFAIARKHLLAMLGGDNRRARGRTC